MSILSEPAGNIAAVTPNDSTTFSDPSRGIWVGTGGDLAVTTIDGTTATFVNVPNGTLLPIRVTKVLDTGTDADDIVRLW